VPPSSWNFGPKWPLPSKTTISNLPCEAKKLHRFIFAIALSELHLLQQFLSHIYFNKFPIIHVFYILYIIRDGEPAAVLKVQQAIAPRTHSKIGNDRALLKTKIKPRSEHIWQMLWNGSWVVAPSSDSVIMLFKLLEVVYGDISRYFRLYAMT